MWIVTQESELVIGIEDGEVRPQPDALGMAAEHPHAEGVEGAEPEPLRRAAEHGRDPLAHLARRLVGEGDGEHLPGRGAACQEQVCESGGQHPRLARARAGENEKRAVERLDGLALLGIQPREIGVGVHRRSMVGAAWVGRTMNGSQM